MEGTIISRRISRRSGTIWVHIKKIYIFQRSCDNCSFPANKYMLKVNNSNTRGRREICSKICVFIVKFEHIFRPSSKVFSVDFAQVMFAGIVRYFSSFTNKTKKCFTTTISFIQKPIILIFC